jgi:hypothetical protein
VSDRNAPQKHVWRAKIILATTDGWYSPTTTVAAKCRLPYLRNSIRAKTSNAMSLASMTRRVAPPIGPPASTLAEGEDHAAAGQYRGD